MEQDSLWMLLVRMCFEFMYVGVLSLKVFVKCKKYLYFIDYVELKKILLVNIMYQYLGFYYFF